jgi:hypothetical protein
MSFESYNFVPIASHPSVVEKDGCNLPFLNDFDGDHGCLSAYWWQSNLS